MNVGRALPKIHFDQTLYRKANTCVFAISSDTRHHIFVYNIISDILYFRMLHTFGQKTSHIRV